MTLEEACAFFDRKYHDAAIRHALKYLLDLDDPRVGSPHKPTILADTPRPQQGAVEAYRSFGKREIDSVLLGSIAQSIRNLERQVSKFKDEDGEF